MIELSRVWKSFRSGSTEVSVLRDCSLVIERGAFAVLLGVSGSGKSTVLNLIGGLDSATRGTVRVAGEDLGRLAVGTRTTFRRRQVGFVFQFYNLLPTLTARENVEIAAELLGVSHREVRRRSEDALESLGIRALGDRFPAQLSGGEQQRLAIARALVKRPSVLLADEPTGNLDGATADDVFARLQGVQREAGMTVVLVTHNRGYADAADVVFELFDGAAVSMATPAAMSGLPSRTARTHA